MHDFIRQLSGITYTPGQVIISVRDSRARVCRFTDEGSNIIGTQEANNWEALEEDAEAAVVNQGSAITQSGLYQCPDSLAARADWTE